MHVLHFIRLLIHIYNMWTLCQETLVDSTTSSKPSTLDGGLYKSQVYSSLTINRFVNLSQFIQSSSASKWIRYRSRFGRFVSINQCFSLFSWWNIQVIITRWICMAVILINIEWSTSTAIYAPDASLKTICDARLFRQTVVNVCTFHRRDVSRPIADTPNRCQSSFPRFNN